MAIKPLFGLVKLKELAVRSYSYSSTPHIQTETTGGQGRNFQERWARSMRVRKIGIARRAGYVPGMRVKWDDPLGAKLEGTIMRYYSSPIYNDEVKIFAVLYEDGNGINRISERNPHNCDLATLVKVS